MSVLDNIKTEIKEELQEKENDRGFLDIITEKAISRKLLVWVASSFFLIFGKIQPDEWVAISLGYIGIEGIADIASKWKSAGKL